MSDNKDKEHYTRVTKILWPFSGLDKIDPDVLENAAIRGTKVHKICEGIVSGLGEIGVEPNIAGYVESFKKWWSIGHEVIMMEERFYDDDLQITGQCDLILKTPEGLVLVDIKTSSRPSKTWEVQGNAYAWLAKNHKHDISKIYFLHLNKNGGFPWIHEYVVDDRLWLSVVKVWEHFLK